MDTKTYVLESVDKAIKQAAASALLVFGADQVNALEAQWVDVAGFALGGFTLSILVTLSVTGLGVAKRKRRRA